MPTNDHRCSVCDEPVATGRGLPCIVCGGWFHFVVGAPPTETCGLYTDRLPGYSV